MAKGLGNQIYDDVAAFGRLNAKIGAIIVFIIAIVLIIVAILIYNSQSHLHEVDGKATDNSVCTQDPCKSINAFEYKNTPNFWTNDSGYRNMIVNDSEYMNMIVNDSKPICINIKSCKTNVEYIVNDESGIPKKYQGTVDTGNKEYKTGDSVPIYYEVNNPGIIKSPPISGWIILALFGLAAFLILIAWSSVYITQKSKAAAAITGTATGIDIIKHVFS